MQTDLFLPESHTLNFLPVNGQVNDLGIIFSPREADIVFWRLYRDVPWQADAGLVDGQIVKSGRQVAWYADQPFRYSHSGLLREALRWEPAQPRHDQEQSRTGHGYNL